MHTVAVHAGDGLGQEAGGHVKGVGHLAADQLVEHNLVGSDRGFGVGVVDLELRRRDLGVVFLVREAQRALHLGHRVDERAQRVARQRVVVATLVHEIELARLVIAAFGVAALEQKAFDLIRGVEGQAALVVGFAGEGLQAGAHVGGVGRAIFLEHIAEHQHLAGAKEVGRQPVERAPVNRQTQVGLGLGGEATDRRAVEGQVVVRLDQEFLVVVEHVQAAFQVAKAHRHRLDALLVGQVAQALLGQLIHGRTGRALGFSFEVELFQLAIGDLEEVAQGACHGFHTFQ